MLTINPHALTPCKELVHLRITYYAIQIFWNCMRQRLRTKQEYVKQNGESNTMTIRHFNTWGNFDLYTTFLVYSLESLTNLSCLEID